ncbi:acyltransferase family protein [Flagellimonas aquimarina]|uniref:acyltransferase family protein n=1 Tax=Flagellimonas aquimarina TaxID=2201895 RepID=UPI001402C612|nr:acyltransferase family protein [Allomuricauda koreensis]
MGDGTRLESIDFFKGLLIILVIVGHVLQGSLDENVGRYLIYSFHMPLFIGLGGYLINVDKLAGFSIASLFKKYFFRIILPWTIAVIGYTIVNYENIIPPSKAILGAFVFPFYHLWFIPAFLSWVLLSLIFLKLKTSIWIQLIIGIFISSIFLILKYFPKFYNDSETVNHIFGFILHTFRPYYYVFFVLGIWLRRAFWNYSFSGITLFSILCFGGVIYLFFKNSVSIEIVIFFLFNFSLLLTVVKVIRLNLMAQVTIIHWIGVNSLAIYLWHVLPITAYKNWVGIDNLQHFYIVVFMLEILFIIIIRQLTKIRFINNYVFGMIGTKN